MDIVKHIARLVLGFFVLVIILGAFLLAGYGLVALVSLWPWADLIGEVIMTTILVLLVLAGSYAIGKEFIK